MLPNCWSAKSLAPCSELLKTKLVEACVCRGVPELLLFGRSRGTATNVDGHGSGVGRRVGLLTGVQLERLEPVTRVCHGFGLEASELQGVKGRRRRAREMDEEDDGVIGSPDVGQLRVPRPRGSYGPACGQSWHAGRAQRPSSPAHDHVRVRRGQPSRGRTTGRREVAIARERLRVAVASSNVNPVRCSHRPDRRFCQARADDASHSSLEPALPAAGAAVAVGRRLDDVAGCARRSDAVGRLALPLLRSPVRDETLLRPLPSGVGSIRGRV